DEQRGEEPRVARRGRASHAVAAHLLLLHLGDELVLRLLHLFRREVGDVLGEDPLVAPAVVDLGDAVAPEHVRRVHHRFQAGALRAVEGLVDAREVDPEPRLPRRLGHLGEHVVAEDHRVADAHRRVPDLLPGRIRRAHHLLRVEGVLPGFDRLGAAVDGEGGSDAVQAFGDGLGHLGLRWAAILPQSAADHSGPDVSEYARRERSTSPSPAANKPNMSSVLKRLVGAQCIDRLIRTEARIIRKPPTPSTHPALLLPSKKRTPMPIRSGSMVSPNPACRFIPQSPKKENEEVTWTWLRIRYPPRTVKARPRKKVGTPPGVPPAPRRCPRTSSCI